MKLQFDANQQYQLDAISAITDLFEGQPLNKGDFELEFSSHQPQFHFQGSLLVGNNLVLDEDTIFKNLQSVQERSEVEVSSELAGMNFSCEMETGTGKTYVYLRAIQELHKKYGFKKFVIVVPSIAIKEGVLKNLEITKEHFDLLYENPEMDFMVYDPKKRGQLKSFATTNSLQTLVINIDSFAKFSESSAGQNIIYQKSDWGIPIKFIQGTRPIVIVDEPQNMETEIRKKAITNLNPLCSLRFSATHRNLYNLVYKLDPVKAYDLGLVKKIEVDSVLAENNFNNAYIELVSVSSQKNSITIKLKIDVVTNSGVEKKVVVIKKSPKQTTESDLFKLSNEKEVYSDGFVIDRVDILDQSVTFSNGLTVSVGETIGGLNDDIIKEQIRATIESHLAKEKRVKEKGIKVLSLFFIDRVANYRNYVNGGTEKGKLAKWFEESFNELSQKPQYKGVIPFSVEKVHNGYFSQDKAGHFKDTKGESQSDDDTYSLIMKDKEKLLSLDEPLRFIFSHSALREGWDNPNVFQICTINETKSELKKRQEIGRGLRLPVNQSGERVFDTNLNVLTVTANESYEDFARKLQTEIEQECGVNFSGRIKNKKERTSVRLKKGYELDENFKDLWDRIKYRTRYNVEYSTVELIEKAGKALSKIEVSQPKIINLRALLSLTEEGVEANITSIGGHEAERGTHAAIPDILGYIQNKTKLTKHTILEIIKVSGRVEDIFINPQQFMDSTSFEIKRVLEDLMLDGIKYEKIAGDFWEMKQFENEDLESYLDDLVKVSDQDKTLYDYVLTDSNIEKQFARDLETREDVKFYFKLPYWFKINTPIGTYNPDWAIVFEGDKRVYFVAETKGTEDSRELRPDEQYKIKCGEKHFEEFEDVGFIAPVKELKSIRI
jgi:type III restriction enzyme